LIPSDNEWHFAKLLLLILATSSNISEGPVNFFVALSVALDETLESQVGGAELAQVRQPGLDAVVHLAALLLGGRDNFHNSVVLLRPLIARARLLLFMRASATSDSAGATPLIGLNRINRLKDVAQLLSSDSDLTRIGSAGGLGTLEDLVVVVEVLRVGLFDDVGGTEHAPGIIDTTAIILDRSELLLAQRPVHIHSAVFALLKVALLVSVLVGAATVSLGKDILVVGRSHAISNLFIGQRMPGGPDRINYLARYIAEAGGSSIISSLLLTLILSLVLFSLTKI